MSGRRFESILAKAFLLVLTLVIGLVVLEIVARRFITDRSPIEQKFRVEYFRRPRPYVMFSGRPHGGPLNSLGYFGPAPAMPKPAGEYRVCVLGGSTVMNGNPTLCTVLQSIFASNNLPHVRIYNFGVASSVSGMELAKILFELADYAPDQIVMYNGGNDILHPLDWDPRPGYPFNFVAYENNVLLESTPQTYPGFAMAAYESAILRRYMKSYFLEKFVNLPQLRKQAGYGSDRWREAIAEAYVRNVIKAGQVAKGLGVEFCAFFQPLVYYKPTLSPEEQYLCDLDAEKARTSRDVRLAVQSRIPRIQAAGVRIEDLSAIYGAETNRVYTDAIHTRQEYKQPVAEAIFSAGRRNTD